MPDQGKKDTQKIDSRLPCILVRKPMEKGKPRPPHFVVYYHAVNAVTKGDGYPIPYVSNVLDAISVGKYFGKLDLASGYW